MWELANARLKEKANLVTKAPLGKCKKKTPSPQRQHADSGDAASSNILDTGNSFSVSNIFPELLFCPQCSASATRSNHGTLTCDEECGEFQQQTNEEKIDELKECLGISRNRKFYLKKLAKTISKEEILDWIGCSLFAGQNNACSVERLFHFKQNDPLTGFFLERFSEERFRLISHCINSRVEEMENFISDSIFNI